MRKKFGNRKKEKLSIENSCRGLSIGVRKIEPTKRPEQENSESSNKQSTNYANSKPQKYTNLRRERLRPASVPLVSMPKKSSSVTASFESYTISRQLDKKQRFDIFIKRLALKPSVSTGEQAIELLNATMIEVENKYAPQKDNKFYASNSRRYGRMHPIPKERIKLNPATGLTELFSVGLITYIHPNGYFEMWTVPRGITEPKRIFKKNALVVITETKSDTTKETDSPSKDQIDE
jgi:hypothetical protein